MLLKIIKLWFKFKTQSDILKKINSGIEVYNIQEREEGREEIGNNPLSKRRGNLYCGVFVGPLKIIFTKRKNILCHREMFMI